MITTPSAIIPRLDASSTVVAEDNDSNPFANNFAGDVGSINFEPATY